MSNKILLLLLIFNFTISYSQDFELRKTPFIESSIFYKDGTSEKGLLRLASSVFDLRLKAEKKDKERKIDHEKVVKIITNQGGENERIFQYLNHNYGKFKIFVELVYTDILSIYISSTDSDDLFYSDFDRQSIPEMMAQARFSGNTGFVNRLKSADTLELPNGKMLAVPIRYTYYYNHSSGLASGASPYIRYYLLKEGTSELITVDKIKRFLKKSREKFAECPQLIDDLEQKRINLRDLPSFIEYYKIICSNKKTDE